MKDFVRGNKDRPKNVGLIGVTLIDKKANLSY